MSWNEDKIRTFEDCLHCVIEADQGRIELRPERIKAAIQLQQLDAMIAVADRLVELNDTMSSIEDRLDNIAFNLSNISKDIVL